MAWVEPDLLPEEFFDPDDLDPCYHPRFDGQDAEALRSGLLAWFQSEWGEEVVSGVEIEPCLMRLESEVEAAIEGHEFPFMVECTTRARRPEPHWRIRPILVEPAPKGTRVP